MALPIQGSVGPQSTSAGDGTQLVFRQGRTGGLIVQQVHAFYYEQTYRGNMYSGANQTAVTTSVALATAYTGFCLYNPPGSGVNLIPNKVKFALSVAPVAISTIGLISGYAATGGVTAQTVKLTTIGNLIGGVSGKGIALSSATIVTPVWACQLTDGFTAAALPSPSVPIDLDGSFIVPPGAFLAIGTLTSVVGLASMSWEEIPI